MSEAITNPNEVPRERNEKGEWRPAEPIVSAPISAWPPQPIKTFHWLFGRPGYIWPENIFWLAVSVFTWVFLTPELTVMKNVELWWVALILVRNYVLIGLVFGGMHYFLYIKKTQGRPIEIYDQAVRYQQQAFQIWKSGA